MAYSQADAGPDKINCFKTGIVIGGSGNPNPSWCYSWSPITGLDNPHILHPTANPSTTTNYTLTVIGSDFSFKSTDVVTVTVLEGFTIKLLRTLVCDGEEVGIKLEPIPANILLSDFITCLMSVNFTSKTVLASLGNPAKTTALTFNQLDSNAESKIQKALWYSTQTDNCNDTSQYEITATATVKGIPISATNKAMLTVCATAGNPGTGNCLEGATQATQYFSGMPGFNIVRLANGTFQGVLTQNTFKRDIKAVADYAPANSQFFDMIRDEELFHQGQFEGTNSSILLNDLWLAQNVINGANNGGIFTGATAEIVHMNLVAAFNTARDNEIARSEATAYPYPGTRRCAIEREAKEMAKSSYKLVLACTYPNCP